MKVDKILVTGVIFVLLMIGLTFSLVTNLSFPTFKYASTSVQLINTTEDVGPQCSSFMWTNRTLDLLAQAVIIFIAAIGCLAMLRTSQKEGNPDD
jgi:hypothetical protein